MNKKELIELLEGVPDDTVLLHSSDDEGNSTSPLNVSEGHGILCDYGSYKEYEEISEEDIGTEYDEKDVFRTLVFW